MTRYESDSKTISSKDEVVFAVLSDLKNLEKYKNHEELGGKLSQAEFESDSCRFPIDGFGTVGVRVVEREPNKKIKLESENLPFSFQLFIDLEAVAEEETNLRLALEADMPMMIKMMVDSKIKNGINMIAEALAKALSK